MGRCLRIGILVIVLALLADGLVFGTESIKPPAPASGGRPTKYVSTVSVAPTAVAKGILRLRKRYPNEAILRRTVILEESLVKSELCKRVMIYESFQTARRGKGLYTILQGKTGCRFIPMLMIEYYMGDSIITLNEFAGIPKEKDYYEHLKNSWNVRFASKDLKLGAVKGTDGSEVPYATYLDEGAGLVGNASIWKGSVLVSISVQGIKNGMDRGKVEKRIRRAISGLVLLK